MPARTFPRGLALRGRVLTSYAPGAPVHDEGVVIVDGDGAVAALGPATSVPVPEDLPVLGRDGTGHGWRPRSGESPTVTPGIVDAHVHLAFGAPEQLMAGGVVAARDLGAPAETAARWRRATFPPGAPVLAVAGPVVTAPGGYPSRSWGSAGFAVGVTDEAHARATVRTLARDGVDLVKLALEPAGGAPFPSAAVARAVVEEAHEQGLAVTCHALTVAMVTRALDAGVDELCHVPVEPLPGAAVQRIAIAGVGVVSTLRTFVDGGAGDGPAANARALVTAGVVLAYGTDLGNTGTRPGADPHELRCLAEAGLGVGGALHAATALAARRPGLAGRVPEAITVGTHAGLVLLRGDPRADLDAVREPLVVVVGPVAAGRGISGS